MPAFFVLVFVFGLGFGEKASAADTTLYVNTASTVGGTCLTNATTGDDRACPTLFAAEALLPADITAGGSAGIWTIMCEGSAADTVAVTFAGTVTDATHYIRVATDPVATNGRHNGIWDNTKYHIDVSNAIALNIGDNYVKVDGLQLTNHALSSTLKYVIAFTAGTFTSGYNEVNLSNLIVKGAGDPTYYQMGIRGQAINLNLNIWNTLVYNISPVGGNSAGMYLGNTNSIVNVYNSTVIGADKGIIRSGGTVNCKNSYAGGSFSGDYSGTITKTTCASSDANGSTGLQTIAVNTTNFTNVSVGTEDLRLPGTGSALYNVGTNTSADPAPLNFTTDIKNTTRPSGGLWDIGADEYEVPADLERPVVTGFTIPTTATSRIISISTFTATDNVGVIGYKITESSTPPGPGDAGWTGSDPATYTITGIGTSHTLYAWAKDAYGNVSNNIITDSVNISIIVASCNQGDVQAEVAVAATGDTINIPAGDCSWTTAVIISNTQDISIIGSGIGNTVITDDGTNTGFTTGRLFHVNTGTGKNIRISGMTLKTGATPPSSTSGLIYIYGTGTATRVDHIDFPAMSYTGVSLHAEYGFASGVVDSSTFTPITVGWTGNGIKLYGGTNGADDSAWTNYSFTPGTNNAWYIENNTFTFFLRGNDAWDAYGGARVVMRYNTVHGAGSGGHGNDSGNYAATHTTEIYNNTFDNTCGGVECNNGTNIFSAVGWRGGTGVMFNNTFDSNIDNPSVVANYRSNPYYEGISTNSDLSTTVLQDSTASFGSREAINIGSYLYNQSDGSYCAVASSTSTSIACSSPLTGGATNRWNAGDHYSQTYFLNDDLMCDGLGPNDGNVSGQQGWLCKQQVGSTYSSGYSYKPIYAWNNNWNGNIDGHLANNTGNSTRSNTYHVLENQTYFNCSSAADCKTQTDAIDIPGFGLNQGWTYLAYACPHPLTGFSGTCNSSIAGISGYNTEILSSTKAITAFNFNALNPTVTGTVNEGIHTIALAFPYGTNVTALIPTIAHTGSSVSPNSDVAQNFTNPVTYTVTAEDASTQEYVVTVTVNTDIIPPIAPTELMVQ